MGWTWRSSTRRISPPYAEIPEDQRQLTEDLIFNRRPDAAAALYRVFPVREVPIQPPRSPIGRPHAGMTPQQRLQWRILHRHKEGVEADIDEILAGRGEVSQHETAVGILNQVLLPAMKEVGDRFGPVS